MHRMLQGGAAKLGRRWVRYMPEKEMRRPAESSKMYRAVQDWKPVARDVAHSAGKELPEEEQNVRMHMILIDKQGFRWPIRFNLTPAMTLWDLFHKTDCNWFGLVPQWLDNDRKPSWGKTPDTFFWDVPGSKCAIDNPHPWKCEKCLVMVPYAYLDAMTPPTLWESEHLKTMVYRGVTHGSANMRVACQVYIEDWMDGMTIVMPQEESMAYQMYYSQGVDKETVHTLTGAGHARLELGSDGYSTPKKASAPLTYKEAVQNMDIVLERGEPAPSAWGIGSGAGNAPLKDIFWTDNVDDVIRAKHPTWKGYYEFLNK